MWNGHFKLLLTLHYGQKVTFWFVIKSTEKHGSIVTKDINAIPMVETQGLVILNALF
jgi:hypothetical protein